MNPSSDPPAPPLGASRVDAPFEPEVLAELRVRAKKQIRARMRALRAGHPASALARRSHTITERLLELEILREAQGIALFWPLVDRGEVDLRALDTALRTQDKRLYYPFMDPNPAGGFRTGFRQTAVAGELEKRGQPFFEPPHNAPIAKRGDVDVVIVPALAVDALGHRVGYGAGYYDATLGDLCPPAQAVLVAFDFQLLAEVPRESHDRACDIIVTDERVLWSTREP